MVESGVRSKVACLQVVTLDSLEESSPSYAFHAEFNDAVLEAGAPTRSLSLRLDLCDSSDLWLPERALSGDEVAVTFPSSALSHCREDSGSGFAGP
jgi:hypothetical protein